MSNSSKFALLGELEGDQRQLLLVRADQLELAASRRSWSASARALRCMISMTYR